MQMEKTLVILKPDALQRKLLGKIISRFEQKGLKLAALKMMRISKELAERHYGVHKGKDFYEPLIRYITSSPVILAILEGKNACAVMRKMMGSTFNSDAEPGTIRGDYALSNRFNLIHGSDNPETAEKEITLFFAGEEIFTYEQTDMQWVYDLSTGGMV